MRQGKTKCGSVSVALIFGALVLSVVPIARAGADKPTSLSKARAAVKANMATPEGQEYENTLSDDFWMSHSEAVTKCVDSNSSSRGKVEVLVKFAKDGSVSEVLITPGGAMADCLKGSLAKEKFPPPPRADYWMHVDVMFAK